jgi:MFS family permease
VLWFDWLYGVYRSGDDEAFRGEVLWPMGLGWCGSAAIAMWQAFGDVAFLNPTFWAALGRVSGSMADANLFGVISAMFGPLLVAVAVDGQDRRGRWLAVAALPVSWLAVWASGSRSSMPLVLIGVVSLVWGFWRSSGSRRVALLSSAAVVTIAVVVALLLTQSHSSVVGPFARFNADFRPRLNADWLVEARDKLLTRDGYGVITSAVIRESPIVGIGIGAFNPLVYLHSWQLFHRVIPADNAQNWFRHELAELGVLGSVGWIAWVVIFGGFLVTARVNPRHLTGIVLRTLLIGFSVISLVGVPGQSIAVTLMFWTFAFAFAGEAGRLRREGEVSTPIPGLRWALVWGLVGVYAAAMVYVGMTFLRPPLQAMRAGLNYASGFYPSDGGSPYYWTEKRAVTVVPVSGRWLSLELIINHPDAYKSPVDIKVWVDGRPVLSQPVTSSYPITARIELSPRASRVLIETWVSRTVRPSDFGGDDHRTLGMAIAWRFAESPDLTSR